jgi:hypothetical protein
MLCKTHTLHAAAAAWCSKELLNTLPWLTPLKTGTASAVLLSPVPAGHFASTHLCLCLVAAVAAAAGRWWRWTLVTHRARRTSS